jgi:hypothetical protein
MEMLEVVISKFHLASFFDFQNQRKNKPKKYPQQPEPKTLDQHAMSEICLLPSPSYSRGQACKAQSQHKHVMKTVFPQAFAILWQLKGETFFPKNCCPPHSLLHT